jgi:hypothetical protein
LYTVRSPGPHPNPNPNPNIMSALLTEKRCENDGFGFAWSLSSVLVGLVRSSLPCCSVRSRRGREHRQRRFMEGHRRGGGARTRRGLAGALIAQGLRTYQPHHILRHTHTIPPTFHLPPLAPTRPATALDMPPAHPSTRPAQQRLHTSLHSPVGAAPHCT